MKASRDRLKSMVVPRPIKWSRQGARDQIVPCFQPLLQAADFICPRLARIARDHLKLRQADLPAAADIPRSALSAFERRERDLLPDAMARHIDVFKAQNLAFRLGPHLGLFWPTEDGAHFTGISVSEDLLKAKQD